MVLRRGRNGASARWSWMRARRGDAGFTLLEMIVGITLMAMVAVGFAASVSMGFRTIALARQRQTASEVASARLEHLRAVPYEDIRMDVKPVHDPDTTHPDYYVSGSDYDVSGDGDIEPMVVASGSEAWGVLHVEDPVTIGATQMEIYQYATWVDDPAVAGAEDFKRVTVVVRYKAPSVNGVNQLVRASSLFAEDTITFPLPTTTTTTVASSTTTTTTTTVPSSTTTTIGSGCSGDTTPPSGGFSILGGSGAEAGFTAQSNATITMAFSDPCEPVVANFSNDGGPLGADVVYDVSDPEFSWSLSSGDGTKTVGGEVRDGLGNSTTLLPVNITLDSTKPTTPGNFSRAVSCSGGDRTVTLVWTASSDTHLRGYRVYRNTGSGFAELGTTSALSFVDTHTKTATTMQFYVVAYDKAGNESDATSTISLSKNQCS